MHRADAAEDFYGDNSESKDQRTDSEPSGTSENKEEIDKQTRDILKDQFGMSDEELDRLNIGADPRRNQATENPGRRRLSEDMRHDPFFAGMDPTSDATSWTDYLKRSKQKSEERFEKLKNESLDTSNLTSKKYHIDYKKEGRLMEKIVMSIVVFVAALAYAEYKS